MPGLPVTRTKGSISYPRGTDSGRALRRLSGSAEARRFALPVGKVCGVRLAGRCATRLRDGIARRTGGTPLLRLRSGAARGRIALETSATSRKAFILLPDLFVSELAKLAHKGVHLSNEVGKVAVVLNDAVGGGAAERAVALGG